MSFTEKGVVEDVMIGLGSIITTDSEITDNKQSAGPKLDQYVSGRRVKKANTPCVSVKIGRALLAFHADCGGEAFSQL